MELGYFIEPPRARVKTIALKSKESIELGCSIVPPIALKSEESIEDGCSNVPPIALKSKESSEEHRA